MNIFDLIKEKNLDIKSTPDVFDYIEIGINEPHNAMKNIDFAISGGGMTVAVHSLEMPMWDLAKKFPKLHDFILESNVMERVKSEIDKYKDYIKEIASHEIGTIQLPYLDSIVSLAKTISEDVNKLVDSYNKALVCSTLFEEKLDFNLDLEQMCSVLFAPKKKFIVELYEKTFGHDISELPDATLQILYKLNESYDSSFENLIPLNETLLEIQKHHAQKMDEARKIMNKINGKIKVLADKEGIESYKLSSEYLNHKRIYVKHEMLVKESIVLMRGLEVVASAEINSCDISRYYGLSENGELTSNGTPKPPEISKEL